jgi:translocation and assembly module TamB
VYRGLVDIEELRRQRLGATFQSRFIDSLRIENLRVVLGPDVWLRSAEAEIQLEGAVQMSKIGPEYIVAGELVTPRGEYTLNLQGLVSRKFAIDRGTVTYLGTPDLDAELDIQATYRVRAEDGDEIPIVARITGSILVPQVELSSPGHDLPERDIVSYLMFGRPEFQLAGSSAGRAGGALAAQALITGFMGELSRQVVQGGTGIDLFEIRPGVDPFDATRGSFTRIAIGVQLGTQWFVTANAGFCSGGEATGVSARNLGASLEYRFARDWRVQFSGEPVQSCSTTNLSEFSNIARRYQLGGDLRWQRDY